MASTTAPKYGSAMRVGRVDQKYVVFYGLKKPLPGGGSTRSMVPKGTFLLSSTNGRIEQSKMSLAGHAFDIVHEFAFPVSVDFPHTMYGNQSDPRYDAKYNLTNPSSDLKTYVSDGKNYMTQPSDNVFYSAEYNSLFQFVPNNSGVNVYVGSPGVAATSPVASSTYTWNAATGTVTFNATQASNAIVSIDGVPTAMAPETMLKHLFTDCAGYDPTYLKFQTSNILIPRYSAGRNKTVWAIAQEIAAMTAPRAVAWRIRVDEFGYIQFYEDSLLATPVETLTDERDLLTIDYTYTDTQIENVVRADAESNNKQPLTSISFDIDSVKDNGQRAPYDIPTEMLLCTRGMNSFAGLSFVNMMTATRLFQYAQPILEITADLLPNPARQVGDKAYITERKSGLTGPYILKGLTDTITKGQYRQQGRFQQAKIFANFAMGLPSAISNATTAQTLDATAAAVSGKTGIVNQISMGGQVGFNNGAQVKDSSGNPFIPIITSLSWDFTFSILQSQNQDTYFWRYWYLETPNSLSSSDLMFVREPSFLSQDGTLIPAATIASGYSNTVNRTTGTSIGSATAYLRSNVVMAANPTFLPSGYNAATTAITFQASTGLGTGTTGLGLGPAYTGSYAFLPQNKQNYGYFCIFLVNTAGAMQILRCPFILQL